jgi:hypothetical protein
MCSINTAMTEEEQYIVDDSEFLSLFLGKCRSVASDVGDAPYLICGNVRLVDRASALPDEAGCALSRACLVL